MEHFFNDHCRRCAPGATAAGVRYPADNTNSVPSSQSQYVPVLMLEQAMRAGAASIVEMAIVLKTQSTIASRISENKTPASYSVALAGAAKQKAIKNTSGITLFRYECAINVAGSRKITVIHISQRGDGRVSASSAAGKKSSRS